MTEFHRLIDRICAHSNDAAHGVEIPAGARLLLTNGQVALRSYGKVPTDTSDQIEIICERFQFILEASEMTFQDVIKLTVYVADPDILEAYHQNRALFRRY